MLSINTNLPSLIAQNSLKTSTNKLNTAIERMTTGFKINGAKDNAANYSITTNMSTKIGAYQIAEENAAMGLDMLTTADENLSLISDKLSRLRALAEQAGNGTYGEQSLSAINEEVNSIVDEINRIYSTAEYNGLQLLGEETSSVDFINPVICRDVSAMQKLADVDATGGLGAGVYSISTVEELQKLAEITNAGLLGTGCEFVLANDIDCAGISNWTPIGAYWCMDGASLFSYAFTGTFDGNGHVIKNLTVDEVVSEERDDANGNAGAGLFGLLYQADIQNLGIENIQIPGKSYLAGAITADAEESSINNCYASGMICGKECGGLVGFDSSSNITNCISEVDITVFDDEQLIFSSNVNVGGGIVGYGCSSEIDNCYFIGTLSKERSTEYLYLGGIIGHSIMSTVSNSYMLSTSMNIDGIFIGYTNAPVDANTVNDSYYSSFYSNSSIPYAQMKGFEDSGKNNINNLQECSPFYLPYEVEVPDLTIGLQVGTDGNDSSRISLNAGFSLTGINALRGIGYGNTDYLSKIDSFLNDISAKQTEYGAVQNRLESALDEISTQYENLVSSRSTLRDADIAEVSSEYIRQQILQQASATLMAAANQSPELALQLL